MKSRISSSKLTALRKDITRFAPVWVLYIVASLLGLMIVFYPYNNYRTAQNIATTMQVMSVVNMIYALLVAQLLFGDLFNSRMCNSLHALPLTRDDWFAIHITSGLLFAFVPHLVFTLISLPFIGELWQVGLWWMLAVDLQYLFFFGLAIFCVFCTGSRFATVVVYGLANFLSILAWWFADVLYQPLLYGIEMDSQVFIDTCPVVKMCIFNYVEIEHSMLPILPGSLVDTYLVSYTVGDGWGYLALCAAIGVGLAVIGLLLYRKRNLETAGDFIAVKFLEPVFLVLYSLTMGAIFQVFEQLFVSDDSYLFLFVGIAVGFYTGRMLLLRTTRVFQPKSLFTLVSLMGLLLASIGFVGMDVLGIIGWVPEANEVKSITVYSDYWGDSYNNYYDGNEFFTVDTPKEIEIMLDVHEGILANRENDEYTQHYANGGVIVEVSTPYDSDYYTRIDFLYEMTDGRTVHRYYQVGNKSDAAKVLVPYFSSTEAVLGMEDDDLSSYISNINDLAIYCESHMFITERDQMQSLLNAIIADCEAGTMAQEWAFHYEEDSIGSIEVTFLRELDSAGRKSINIHIYPSCENTIAWLTANGVELWEISKIYK